MSDILVKFSYGCKNILFELIAMKQPFFIIIIQMPSIPGLPGAGEWLPLNSTPYPPVLQAHRPFQHCRQ
jgi:hypothetical protein